jgi:hypothetical protein
MARYLDPDVHDLVVFRPRFLEELLVYHGEAEVLDDCGADIWTVPYGYRAEWWDLFEESEAGEGENLRDILGYVDLACAFEVRVGHVDILDATVPYHGPRSFVDEYEPVPYEYIIGPSYSYALARANGRDGLILSRDQRER